MRIGVTGGCEAGGGGGGLRGWGRRRRGEVRHGSSRYRDTGRLSTLCRKFLRRNLLRRNILRSCIRRLFGERLIAGWLRTCHFIERGNKFFGGLVTQVARFVDRFQNDVRKRFRNVQVRGEVVRRR